MNSHSIRFGIASLALAILIAPQLKADPIIAGTTELPGAAIQDITLPAFSPLNPGATPIVIQDLTGYGTITINRDAQVGSTITFDSLSGGMYYGYNAELQARYVFGNIAPLTGADFSGSITNVVQNTSDSGYSTGQPSSFQSGNFSLRGNSFGFEFLSGNYMGLTVFTDASVPFSFSSTFDGLPPSNGTVLVNSGTDVLNILYGGQVIAQSSDRRIIISNSIPEPSGIILLSIGAAGLCGYVRRGQAKA
jgi:hypothetical protein